MSFVELMQYVAYGCAALATVHGWYLVNVIVLCALIFGCVRQNGQDESQSYTKSTNGFAAGTSAAEIARSVNSRSPGVSGVLPSEIDIEPVFTDDLNEDVNKDAQKFLEIKRVKSTKAAVAKNTAANKRNTDSRSARNIKTAVEAPTILTSKNKKENTSVLPKKCKKT